MAIATKMMSRSPSCMTRSLAYRLVLMHSSSITIEILDDFGHITSIKLCGGKAEHDPGAYSIFSGMKPNHPPQSISFDFTSNQSVVSTQRCLYRCLLPICFSLLHFCFPEFPHWLIFTETPCSPSEIAEKRLYITKASINGLWQSILIYIFGIAIPL